MKTRGRTQDGDADESGDGNKSSNGICNGDEDGSGNRNMNDDRIGEGGGEAKNRNKPRTRVVDAMWETGETWVERKKYEHKKGFVQ